MTNHEPAMADLRACPFTTIPTELVQLIASNLDKKSLAAFRITSKAVKERIEFVFKASFQEIQYNILDWDYEDEKLSKFITKELDFLKSEHPSKVEAVTWIIKFAIINDKTLPSALDNHTDTPLDYCILHMLRSHCWFDNLKTIRLASYFGLLDFKEAKTPHQALWALEDEIVPMMRVLPCLFDHCSRRALKIEFEIPKFLLCTVMWTGRLKTTGDIHLHSQIEYPTDDSVSEQPVRARAEQLWYETGLSIFCWQLQTIFNHPIRALRLCGFTIRPKDLVRLCNGDDSWPTNAPETLVLESCTIHSNNRGLPTTGVITNRDVRDLRDAVSHVRHLEFLNIRATPSFLDVEAELAGQGFDTGTTANAWEYFFGLLAENIKTRGSMRVLQSLRFEHGEGVYFDWDHDGNMDHGERLPEMIEKVGVQGALKKMAACYRYKQPQP